MRIEIPVDKRNYRISLGRVSENLVTKVVIDCSSWAEEYGAGTAELIHKRNADDIAYKCLQTSQEDNLLTWTVTSDDTAFEGRGWLQARWYVGDVLKQSAIFDTMVLPSLTESEDEPAQVKSALDLLLQSIENIDVEQAVKDYMDENPMDSPVTSVNSQTGDVVITAELLGALTQHQDISGKADKADLSSVATSGSYTDLSNKPAIPSSTSDLTNDSDFQTSDDVTNAINTAIASVMHYKGTVATTLSLPSSDNTVGDVYHVTERSSEYAWDGTQWQELGTEMDLSSYATKTWVEGKGYLTSHQDISGKADKADLASVATSGSYNDLSDKPSIPAKTSDLTNDSGFITEYTETDPTVPAWAKASTKPSYTASEVGALPSTTVIPSKTSDLTNDSGFLTQHQDISGKADKATTYTKTEVDIALSAKAGTAIATTSANGLMSSTDKGRLDDLYADYSSALTALGVN